MTTHLFGQTAQAQEVEARKAAAVESLQVILKRVATSRHQAMVDDKVTVVAHPNDFQVPSMTNAAIQLLRFGSMVFGSDTYDIVVYRLQVGQEAAFGLHNGSYVDPRRAAPVCITMRPTRFVEVMVPEIDQAQKHFEVLDQMIATLGAIFPEA